MIELFYHPTPNGRKISILLEELELKYKLTKIDITKNEQFSENFSKISPLNNPEKMMLGKHNEAIK